MFYIAGKKVKLVGDDLFSTPLDQSEIDFSNEGGETYICGNPPYLGRRNQNKLQKEDIKTTLAKKIKSSASLDYVFCWIEKASEYVLKQKGSFAFVSTNSICQGTQVGIYWPHLFKKQLKIIFAQRSFMWSNNAKKNAGVACVIVGVGADRKEKFIFEGDKKKITNNINPYLTIDHIETVVPASKSISKLFQMKSGNMPADGNYLTLSKEEYTYLIDKAPESNKILIPLWGTNEYLYGKKRYGLWIDDNNLNLANSISFVRERIKSVEQVRCNSKDKTYNSLSTRPHQFRDRNIAKYHTILIPIVSSEKRDYLPIAIKEGRISTTNSTCAMYDAPILNLALLSSKMHASWLKAICGRLETRLRYSNTLIWNTFPLPKLTEKNKADLTRSAENILLARETHFPATIADLYDPDKMPENLKQAHAENDEILERIYIGRRFKNDTERLEKLFELYAKMTKGNN